MPSPTARVRRRAETIGLVPCGGHATRISPLPCSKEILPVGLRDTADGSVRAKVVSHYLLESMQRGGVGKAFFILRKGKWDIPAYYGDGTSFGMDLGYLVVRVPHGPAYTVDQAYPFVREAQVAFGFPDVLFEPPDAFARALTRLTATRASVVLVCCRARNSRVEDVVAIDRQGRIRELLIRSGETTLKLGWVLAVWAPSFTEFLHEHLRSLGPEPPAEMTLGHVIQAAVHDGLVTQSVVFPEHSYLDVGTPEGLRRLRTRMRSGQK